MSHSKESKQPNRFKVRWFFYLGMCLLLFVTAIGIKDLRVNNDILDWLPANHPDVREYKKQQKKFQYASNLFMAVPVEGEIFSSETFYWSNRLSSLIKDLPGKPDVHFLLDTTRMLPFPQPFKLSGVEQLPKLKRMVLDRPKIFTPYVIRNPDHLVFHLQLKSRDQNPDLEMEWVDSLLRVTDRFQKSRRSENASTNPIKIAGTAATAFGLNRAVFDEGQTIIGISYLFLFALLCIFLRSWKAIAAGLLIVSLTAFTTHGLMALLSIPLNIMTISVSSLILVISVADVIHISNHLKAHGGLGLEDIIKPCFWTTLTTMLGFGSLSISSLPILSQFGLAAALGIGLALLWSLFLYLPLGGWIFSGTASKENPLRGGVMILLLDKIYKYKYLGLVMILVTAMGSYKLKDLVVDADPASYLPQKGRLMADLQWFQEKGLSPSRLNYQLIPNARSGPEAPLEAGDSALWIQFFKAQKRLQAERQFRDVLSPMTGLREEEVLTLAQSKDPRLVDIAEKGLMTLSIGLPHLMSSKEINAWKKQLKALPLEGMDTRFQGFMALSDLIFSHVLDTQIRSGLLALGLIALVLILLLRRTRLIFWGLLANFFPIFSILVYMSWTGIELDITTVCIASIALGVVVDDTIHIMWNIRQFSGGEGEFKSRFSQCLQSITSTTWILCFGFGVLYFSSIKSIHLFGLLISLSLAVAWAFDLFILPFCLERGIHGEKDVHH